MFIYTLHFMPYTYMFICRCTTKNGWFCIQYPPTPADARGSAPGNKTSKFSRTSSKSSGSGSSSGSSESSTSSKSSGSS